MKRFTLLCLAVALLLPATANAQLTMQMSNGWTFSFAGNVNVFWSFTKRNNSGPANSNIRTGLLPAFATFEARGKEAGLNLAVHFGFAPQIQNFDGAHDQFGTQIDMRQVYLTIGFKDGSQILAGRELGLFSRQNILNDMTLYGVGAVGLDNITLAGVNFTQGGGTTLGRIGYGYIYPNFNAQVTYSSKPGRPAQLSIGLFQPSVLGSGGYDVTKIPRLEAEATWNHKTGNSTWLVWVGGLWQTTSNLPTGGTSVSSIGADAGVRGTMSDFSVVVSGYIGKGLGTTLAFSGNEVAPNGTDLRTSDGGIVQVGYTVNKKTTVGGSWGFSRLKNASAGETVASGGNDRVRSNLYATTVGIYHQWTKSLKLVFEGTQEGTTNAGTGRAKQIDLSGGFMLFF